MNNLVAALGKSTCIFKFPRIYNSSGNSIILFRENYEIHQKVVVLPGGCIHLNYLRYQNDN